MSERDQIGLVGDIPRVYAASRPDKVALYHFDGAITYSVLNKRANQVANGLLAFAIPRQSRIILLAKNDVRFFDLMFGAALAGMALTPVNWRLSPAEVRFIIQDSESPVVCVSREFLPVIREISADLPNLRHLLVLDGGESDDFDAWRDRQAPEPADLRMESDEDVLQLYTSGTTGQPKGALLTNRNVMAYLHTYQASPIAPYPEGTLVMVALPLFHVGGSLWSLNALFHGEADLILREASAAIIVEAFQRFPITKASMVPAVMKMVIEHPGAASTDFSHLDVIGYGASPIDPDLLTKTREIFNCDFVQVFGMTEACALATFLGREDHSLQRADKMLSVGKSCSSLELRVIGRDGKDLPADQSGELLLRGETIMKGYWRRPDATAEAIVDGWYHTGDVGYVDEEGYVFLQDRLKDMIITGGENVYSAEVERVLSEYDKISEVAVIGIPDPVWGESVKAVVVPRAGVSLDEADVIAYARSHLAAFKCPKTVDFLEALPRNATGKILKRALREPYWGTRERNVA